MSRDLNANCHVERSRDICKQNFTISVRAAAARGAGAWKYAPLPRGGPDRIVSFRSALDSNAFWNHRSVGIRRDALPQQGSIVPQKLNAFSVSIPQNGTSMAKTAIVTEKHDHFCGRNTWRSEQMSCRIARQIPLYGFLINLVYSGAEKRIQCHPYGTVVQSFGRFSVQRCSR